MTKRLLDSNKKLSTSSHNIKNLDNESDQIKSILTEITKTKLDSEFSIINNNISYKLGHDSKILSKIYEIILIDQLKKILDLQRFKYLDNNIQNKYPDFIILSNIQSDKYYAVDIKSTYLKTPNTINGFTLGTYNGYFKDRDSLKSIVKSYKDFLKHWCIGVIYDRCSDSIPVKHLLIREKWEIASNVPGSGNTNNIGSLKNLSNLLENKPYFKSEDDFNQFWLSYQS